MEYRLNKELLLNVLEEWNRFLKRKVHLIACGGTAMVGHFNELVSFDIAEARLRPHMQHFLELLQKRGLYD